MYVNVELYRFSRFMKTEFENILHNRIGNNKRTAKIKYEKEIIKKIVMCRENQKKKNTEKTNVFLNLYTLHVGKLYTETEISNTKNRKHFTD